MPPEQPPTHGSPPNDEPRLAALRAYGVLDTPREADFDNLVALAAQICGTPICVVNLIENDRQWFKAEVGLGIRETPLDISICRHMLLQPGITEIQDLRSDPRLCANPLVTAAEGLRFYAGCLLETPDGVGIGTLCVIDRIPRQLTEAQRVALKTLAHQVMTQLELRRALKAKRQLLQRNATLLTEVHHRTKNNLHLIQSLVQLQLRRSTEEGTRSALADLARRIGSIAAAQSHLNNADAIGVVDASAYVLAVVEAAQAAAPRHRFETRLGAAPLNVDDAVPLSLIANEMITNAVKYAYDEHSAGSIQVTLAVDGATYRLTVSDQGRGLPEGFDQGQGRSLGMSIMRALARQLEGTLGFAYGAPGLVCTLAFGRTPRD